MKPSYTGCLAALLVLAFLFLPDSLPAASRSEPAFREVIPEAGYPWSEGLRIRLVPDEAACRKKYGNRWRQKCAAALAAPGSVAKGISLSPPARGTWRWRDSSTIAFAPASGNALKPGTLYSLDISDLHLPCYVAVNRKSATVRTLPLSARLVDSNFWIDPSAAQLHRLGMTFEFNFPVSEAEFHMAFQTPSGCETGNPEIVWNQERDRAVISWPVRKLPRTAGPAAITLAGMGRLWFEDGQLRHRDAEGTGSTFTRQIPGINEIFRIANASLEKANTASLDQKHILEIETSTWSTGEKLHEHLLVVELPEFRTEEATVPYDWTAAPRLSSADLKKGRLIRPVPLQKDKAEQGKFRFELPVQSGRYIFAGIDDRLTSASGQKLASSWGKLLRASPELGNVGFMQPGNVLPAGSVMDVFGNDLDSIQWEVQLVEKPFLALIAQSSRSPFRFPLDDLNISMDSLASVARGELALPRKEEGKAQYASLPVSSILGDLSGNHSGLILVRLRGIREGKEIASSQRLILATDLGLLVKKQSRGEIDCFAYALSSGKPASGAQVSILGANGKPVAMAKTDSRGHAAFSSVAGLARESLPVAVVADLDSSLAWMPLTDTSRELNLSDFSTGGTRADPNSILAFIFSQRGIYRPGETLHFGCLPRYADFTCLPEKLPLFAELQNPAGRKIWQTAFTPGASGLADISWQSPADCQSGRYTLVVRNSPDGDIIASESVRLESFQPETLKLKIDMPAKRGWIVTGRESPSATIHLQNLFGTPAKDHRLRVEAATSPAVFSFRGYEEYIFKDPCPFMGDGVNRRMPDLRTDSEGAAAAEIPMELTGASARITLTAEGFDAGGGRATTGSASLLTSPSEWILGYRPAGALTNPGFINRGAPASLELLALDPDLEPIALRDLEFTLLARNFVTSLISDGAGSFRYDETPQELVLASWSNSLPEGPSRIELRTEDAGDFILRISDQKGRILAQIPYVVVGEKLANDDTPLAASRMRIRLDRENYDKGEEIKIAFSLPYQATGLLTLERDRVEAFQWIKAHAGDNVASIRIPVGFEGRGYVTLTFMRGLDSKAIYMTPLAYAVAPFTASVGRRNPGLTLAAPESSLPGQNLNVKISAAKPCKAIIFAVDQGILQLSTWKTPQPLATLLTERGLAVSTLQTADLVMPDHARLAPRISAFGGGAEFSPFGAKFQNPFKRKSEPPLVYWSGIVPVGNDPATVQIPIAPWQTGRLTIFAVAAGTDCAGSARAEVTLSAPLMLALQAPNALVPGDRFEGALVLTNTTENPLRISLNQDDAKGLKIIKGLQQSVDLAASSEMKLDFEAVALDAAGEAGFHVTASTDAYRAESDLSISIRPPGQLRTTLTAGTAYAGMDLPVTREVYPFLAESSALVSNLPLPIACGLGKYLEFYPHGCTEQLVSRAFSAMILRKWNLPEEDATKYTRLTGATHYALSSRNNGSLVSLWPDSDGDLLLTAYATDYLLALRETGGAPADDLLDSLCQALSWNLNINEPDLRSARAVAYALWVLARSGRVVTQELERLLASLADINGWEADITGAFVAAIQAQLGFAVSVDSGQYQFQADGWFDEFAQRALLATILAKHFPDKLSPSFVTDFLDAATIALNRGAFSTFSASQGIRALAYVTGSEPIRDVALYCADKRGMTAAEPDFIFASSPACERYHLEAPQRQTPLFWQISTTGFDRGLANRAESNGIEISRVYQDPDGNSITSAQQGDQIIVRITASSQEGAIPDCVISDLLPGCLELIIPARAQPLPERVRAIDRQEDRVLIFADLAEQPLELEYRARVVSAGDFNVPPVSAEAMYDQQRYARGPSGHFAVQAAQ